MYILPLLSLAALATALPSESLVWTKVNTSKPPPTSTSSLVWSKVNTAKPTSTSTSPLVWSKVETAKPSPSSSSTLAWTKVITTRTSPPSSTSTTASPSSTSTAPSCPGVGSLEDTLKKCWRSTPLEWFNATTYLNYLRPSNKIMEKETNGTGYYSGEACENVVIDGDHAVLRVAVSDELAAQYGGMDAMCGKKLVLTIDEAQRKRRNMKFVWPVRAIVTRSCSKERCPGVSIGTGSDWYEDKQDYKYRTPLPFAFGSFFSGLPDKFNIPVENYAAWIDW